MVGARSFKTARGPSLQPSPSKSMRPIVVFAILGATLVLTTTLYFVSTPSDLKYGLPNSSNTGHWGIPNAEFDWCEYNYLWSFYIAEPINSFSMISFIYIIFQLSSELNPIMRKSFHIRAIFVEIFLVAVGSFAFHATLQYQMQLADELPMLLLVLHTSYVLYIRPNALSSQPTERPIVFFSFCLFFSFTALGLLFTDRSQSIHSFLRGCTTYAFSGAFLYIFVAQSAASCDLDRRFPTSSKGMFSSIFSKGFCSFMFAIFGWVVENVGCYWLQNLPFSFPFPHFHGVLWHLGCALGMRYLILIAAACSCHDQEKAVKAIKVFYYRSSR